MYQSYAHFLAFFQEFFRGGGEGESIVMQIYIVLLIFVLFSDQISGGKVSEGEKLLQGGASPAPLCRRARFLMTLGKFMHHLPNILKIAQYLVQSRRISSDHLVRCFSPDFLLGFTG